MALHRHIEHGGDQARIVDARQLFAAGRRRLLPIQRRKCGLQGRDHMRQALRALGMAVAGVVAQAGWMRINPQAHERWRSWFHNTSPWPLARASTRQITNNRSDRRLR